MRISLLFLLNLTILLPLIVHGQNGAPMLTSPDEGAVLDNGCSNQTDMKTWDFSWESVDGADRYHLFVQRLGSQFPAVNKIVKDTSFTESQRAYVARHNTDGWTWRVRALVNGKWTKWSSLRSFSVEPIDTDCPMND
jgi:hypothetical protein